MTAEFDFDAVITQNTTVYAKWSQIKTYTVKFVSNGTTFATKKVVEGEAVEYPDDPQPPEDRIYHYFAAWSTMDLQVEVDDFDYDFGEPVYEDITLYARFVADRDSYAADNAEVIEQLIKVRDQLSQNKGEFLALGDAQFEMVVTVADVLTQVIDLDQYQFIITKLNIGAFYPVEVMNVQKLFETLSDEEKSRFADVMSGLDEDTYNFLIDFFEIDIDKYM